MSPDQNSAQPTQRRRGRKVRGGMQGEFNGK
jgi:hypothetical protein